MAEEKERRLPPARKCALFPLLALSLVLQAAPACAAEQLPLTAYDQGQGLETLSITRLAQDREGQIWVGTENGLYLYDGIGFVAMDREQGFTTSEIVAMAADEAGDIWVASRSGLQLGHNGRFTPVEAGAKPVIVDRGQTLAPLADGGLALVSDRRLMELRRDRHGRWRLQPIPVPAAGPGSPEAVAVQSVFRLGDALWFGCGDFVCVRRDGQVRRYAQADNVAADRWLNFLQARDGTLWVRGTRALRALPQGRQAFVDRSLPADKGEVAASGLEMVQDAEGGILTRSAHGIARWNGGGWEFFDGEAGIPQIGVSTLLADRDGSVWLGTFGRGVLHWGGYGLVRNWTPRQGLSSPLTWSIAADADGDVWVANELGGNLISEPGGAVSPWPVDVPPPHQSRTVLQGRDGSLWIVLFDGRILQYRNDTRQTTTVATVPYFVRGGYLDRDGALWALSLGGPYRIEAGAGAVRVAPALVPDGMCSDMDQDAAGDLWLACSSGLYRRHQGQWRKLRESPDASASGYEHVVAAGDGRLLLSTLEPGLLEGRVSGDRVELKSVDDALLARSRFYFLRRDRAGRIWAGGGNGVDVLDDGRWQRLSMQDGLVWNETDHNAFYAAADGSVWIGTAAGVSHLLDPKAMLSTRRLSPRLLSVGYGGRQLDPARTHRLPVGQGALELRLAVAGNSAGYPVHFRYRLHGIDDDWIQTQSRELRYASLPAGSYRFELQLLDDNQRTSSAPLRMDFRLAAPWWRSPWAYAAYALLGLLGLMALWHWRNRRLISHAQYLEHLVDLRTSELQDEKRELERTQAQLYLQATHDQLTGVLNRSAVMDALQRLARPAKDGCGLALALLDVDHFKSINDRYGHVAGDTLLRDLARWLAREVPADALFGRYGGEEFLLAMRSPSPGHAASVVRDLLARMAGVPHAWREETLRTTCSAGIAWLAPGATAASLEELIERADRLLYRAKQQGRNRAVAEDGEDATAPPPEPAA